MVTSMAKSMLLCFCSIFLLAGCGSSDPLVGTWKGTSGIDTLVYIIESGGTFAYAITGQDASSGCTQTASGTGTWMTNGNMLTMQVMQASIALTGCTDATKDMAAHPDSGIDTSPHVSTYAISGNTLSITPSGSSNSLSLARQ